MVLDFDAQKSKQIFKRQEKLLRELIIKSIIEINDGSITIVKQDNRIVNIGMMEKIDVVGSRVESWESWES